MHHLQRHFQVIALIFLISCASSYSSGTRERTPRQPDYSNLTSLDQVLRRVGGLQVQGVGTNVKVYMRGQGSILYNTQPLYVVDGVPLGNDYNQANNAINVQDIVSVQTVPSMSATIRYGTDANHGAILIKTKTMEDTKEGGKKKE